MKVISSQWSGVSKGIFSFALSTLLFVLSYPVEAQQQPKIAKIGELVFRDRSDLGAGREAFRQRLRELGYFEGKNIAYETRSAKGDLDRYPTLADELTRLNIDVLVASSINEAIAFKNATKTIPIVFVMSNDPLENGLIDSLARPGGNITGFTFIAPLLAGKRLELLKEAFPKFSRVAVLWNPQDLSTVQQWKESQLPARDLGLHLHSIEVSSVEQYEHAFKQTTKHGRVVIIVMGGALNTAHSKPLQTWSQISAAGDIDRREFVASGGLMSSVPTEANCISAPPLMSTKS